jgi:hypothetical protein
MAAEPAYKIDVRADGMTIRVRNGALDREGVSRFLDYLVLESIRNQSMLTEDKAEELAREVKQGAWERVRHLFEPQE